LITKKDINEICYLTQSLLNRTEIVDNFIRHGETSLAVEHLLYMVYESDICIPTESKEKLISIAKSLGICEL